MVPVGESAAFLSDLPVEVLEEPDAVGLLRRLGLRTLGALAGLPPADVRARFGARTAWVQQVVLGADHTLLAPRTPPPDLVREIGFEPPLDSAETVCFSARRTAEEFVASLAARNLACTEVRVEVECEGTVVSSRTWLHPRWFSASDLVDRLHWQLQGGFRGGAVRAPVELVRLVPETAVPDSVHADGLWGGTDERVERGIARVQGMLGHEAVVAPVLQGGRSPAERQGLVPWGERPTDLRPRALPWPGQHPAAGPGPGAQHPLGGPGARGRRHGRGRRRAGRDQRGAGAVSSRAGRRLAAGRRLGRPVAGGGAVVGDAPGCRAAPHRPLPAGGHRRPGLAAHLRQRRGHLVHRGGVRLMAPRLTGRA